jgi:dipeptidyl aminopeptidase/acylaminoacyl peptidase
MLFPDEGHGLFKPSSRNEFWTRVEQFLATHLARPADGKAEP